MTVFFLAQEKKAAEEKKDGKKGDSKTGVNKGTSNDKVIDDDKDTDDKETVANGGGNNETGFNGIKKMLSEADSEKTANQKKRNTQEETEKKAANEGEFIGKEITSKISFGKKINQLEEALKKLRKESTQ